MSSEIDLFIFCTVKGKMSSIFIPFLYICFFLSIFQNINLYIYISTLCPISYPPSPLLFFSLYFIFHFQKILVCLDGSYGPDLKNDSIGDGNWYIKRLNNIEIDKQKYVILSHTFPLPPCFKPLVTVLVIYNVSCVPSTCIRW
jgi:hypothetical protein